MRHLALIPTRAPEDSVQWVRRERGVVEGVRGGPREIELPEDWSTEAAEALLAQGGGGRTSVREWVRAVGDAFVAQGRSEEARLAPDDVAQWRTQLERLLLTQGAVVCLPQLGRADDGPDATEQACAGLRLTRFLEPNGRLNSSGLRQAIRLMLLVLLLARDGGGTTRQGEAAVEPQVSLLDLGALLMASGVPYDSDAGRAISIAVSALVSADLTLHGQGWGALAAESKATPPGHQPLVAEAQRRLQELDGLRPAEERIVSIRRNAATGAQGAEETPPLVRQLPELLEGARLGWGEILRRARHDEVGRLVRVGRSRAWMLQALDCDGDELSPLASLTEPERRAGVGRAVPRRAKHAVRAGLDRLRYTARQRDTIVRELERNGAMASSLSARHRAVFAVRHADGKAGGVRPQSEERLHLGLRLFADLAATSDRAEPDRAEPMWMLDAGTRGLQGEADVPTIESRLLQEHAALLAVRVTEEPPSEGADRGERWIPETPPAQENRVEPGEQLGPVGQVMAAVPGAVAVESLPAERQAVTHSFQIDGREGTLTVGLFQDGRLGEIYLRMPRESSAVKGLLDAFSTATSLALQRGVSLRDLASQLEGLHFEPSGATANPEIPTAQSPMDYLVRWLAVRFAPLLSSS